MSKTLTQAEKQRLLVDARSTMGVAQFNQFVATAAVVPIAEQMIENSVVRKLFQTDRFSVGPVQTYTLKKRMGVALIISKFGLPASAIIRQQRVQVEPYIISHKHELNRIDVEDANYNIISDSLSDASDEMNLKEDNEVLRVLNTYAADPGGAPANTTYPTVSAGPGGQGNVLSTNAFVIGSTQTAPAGGAAGDPTVQNMLVAQSLHRMIGYEPDTQLMNPYALGKLMGQDNYFRWDASGTREVREKGMITDAFGQKLVWSRLVPQRTIYVIDSSELARWVERNSLTIEPKTEDLMMSWFMWERACPFIRNVNAYLRVVFQT